ncbi:hypothetical protein CWE12_11135 [Aliidiomarina sedimenti]|uniref:Anti-sigma factor n=1 Tax=Aliidiomarina sedimenti TaxID=1933879 RepID=A0ABY0BWV4_9GAMM|nr:hypothetical protein [Aliidiomarina sedimenti]RUO28855.1 hypothetical protein CWE12_11135 [Aliidiomarina sedimenti]
MSHEKDPDLYLDQQVARLSREITPQTDLWAQLEPELDQAQAHQPAQGRLAFVWGAVASVLLVGVLLVVTYVPSGDQQPDLSIAMEASAEAEVITAYETAIAERIHVLQSADSNWGDVEHQLEMFRSAVAEIRFALSFQPHNPGLLQQLQDVYQQQLAWLQAVSSYHSATLS